MKDKKKEDLVTTSLTLPKSWIKQLKTIAHQASIDEEEDVSLSTIMRRALEKTYSLKKEKKHDRD